MESDKTKKEAKFEKIQYQTSIRCLTNILLKALNKEKPLFCEICQKEKKLVIHHLDYGNPLNILYLCLSCHQLVHGVIKRAKKE